MPRLLSCSLSLLDAPMAVFVSKILKAEALEKAGSESSLLTLRSTLIPPQSAREKNDSTFAAHTRPLRRKPGGRRPCVRAGAASARNGALWRRDRFRCSRHAPPGHQDTQTVAPRCTGGALLPTNSNQSRGGNPRRSPLQNNPHRPPQAFATMAPAKKSSSAKAPAKKLSLIHI